MKTGIGTKIIFSQLITILLVVLITLYIAIVNSQKSLIKNIGKGLQALAAETAKSIDNFMYERIVELKILSQADVFESNNRKMMDAYLSEIIAESPHIKQLSVIGMDERIIASSHPDLIGNLWFEKAAEEEIRHLFQEAKTAKQGDVFFRDVHKTADGQGTFIELLTPVTDEENTKVLKVLLSGISMIFIQEQVSDIDARTIGEKAAYLVNDPGEVIFSLDTYARILEPLPDINANPYLREVLEGDKEGYITYRDHQGDIVLAGYADLKEYGLNKAGDWSIISIAPRDEILMPVYAIKSKLIVAGIAVTLAGVLIAFVISRGMVRPLVRIVDVAKKIGEGRLDEVENIQTSLHTQGSDEIAQLSQAIFNMVEGLRRLTTEKEQQLWLAQQQSGLSDTMRGELNISALADKVITYVCNSMDACVGALYLNGDGILERVSGFAYTEYNHLPKRFKTGEGLVGQAALSQEIRVTVNTPDDYIKVSSGLGEYTPQSILEAPFLYKNKVVGIIELGSMSTFTELHLTFITQAAESIAMAFNITQSQNLLEERAEELKAINTYKSEFLANMSHEIRTPLNAIIGVAELLAETSLTEDQKNYVNLSRRSGDTLLSVINDILDLSKMEAGQLSLESVEFDLGELVENIVGDMAFSARDKKLEIISHIHPGTPTMLTGDFSRLRQIVINLMSNAIKFTSGGEIVLSVQADPETRQPGRLLFSVSDTGIGIPPEKQISIFEAFIQADTSTTRKFGGTGLGLNISKRIVEMMEGRLWVESEPGRGSTFFFTALFGSSANGKQPPPLSTVSLTGISVLVVDDNHTNRLIMKTLLTAQGMLVSEAESGKQALAELNRAVEGGKPYQLMLLDSNMPEMSGFEVVERMRSTQEESKTAIVVLTSDLRKNDPDRLEKLKVSRYLQKPIRRGRLIEVAASALGLRQPETSRTKKVFSVPADDRPLRILLVEDSEDNRMLVHSFLKKTPYQLQDAENGKIAVEKFRSATFDIVLMDMQMPVMDGLTATRAIRKWEKETNAAATPIMALTAHALKEYEQKSLEAGCTAHLTKPIKKNILLQAIREYTAHA